MPRFPFKIHILIITPLLLTQVYSQKNMKPPVAQKVPKSLVVHQQERIDNYYWLNDREDKNVIKYLKEENKYSEGMLKHTEDFQTNLFNEMVGRIKQTDLSVPYRVRGYWYYNRYEEGKEYPIYCRKKGTMDEKEEIMLDVNQMAKGSSYYDVTGLSISTDNNLLAYGVDNVSRRKYTLYVKNLSTGEVYKESVPNTDGSYVWANDNKTLFYDVKDEETLRTYLIKKHILGTEASKDENVFEEKDVTFNCGVYKSKSEDYIFIGSYSTLTSEVQYLEANNPDKGFVPLLPRYPDHLYSAEYFNGYFYLTTNFEAKNFKLVRIPVKNNGADGQKPGNWEEIIPHRRDVLLDGIDIFKNYLVVSERQKGLTQIRVKSWDGKVDYQIPFKEAAFTVYTSVNPDFDTDILRYSYTSLVTPNSIYDFDMKGQQSKLLKQQEVVGGYDPSVYQSERIFVKAKDGIQVPISLVYNAKVTKPGANTPLLLYGYGSYGASMDPYFSSVRLSLLDRGFVFAIAHIRGGQEMGRDWYEDGKLLNKMNTFTDFTSCAEFLISNNYTSAGHLYAMGGSAGGLLMGAVVNMRPDLFKGIVAQVPFVDVVTTMLDESIPLTTGEFDEWGNPKDKTYYEYMMKYSPYDNVRAQNYPNMLVTTGLHDSQVQYWEPAKWVAKLRELKTDQNKILFHCEMEAGHGGKSGRFERLKEVALEYAFLLDLEGIRK
jgi:oligopeptidase B